MSWFGGFVADSPQHPAPVPANARALFAEPFPLWVVGDWPPAQVTVVTSAGGYLAVFGSCAASPGQLAPLLGRLPGDAITRWPGAYVIVRATGDGVTVLTDAGTALPIYTAATAHGVVWASSSRALASLTGTGVDVAWLAAALSHPASPNAPSRSAFTGVSAVPAGHRLTLCPRQPPRSVLAWQPSRASDRAAAQRLRQALHAGIAVRVATAETPTSDLSGGMDSTAVCLVAASHASRPLTAVTVHPAGITTGGDLDYARAAAAHRPGVRHVLLPLGSAHLPYADLDQVPPTDEPAPSTVTYARFAAELAMLAELGSDAHLTGDGGDSLLIPPPSYLTDLARTGRLLRLARHVQGRARLHQVSPWPLLAQAVTARQPNPGPPAWISSDARHLAATVAEPLPRSPRAGRGNTATLAEIQAIGRSARADAQIAETFGFRLHNPFTDGAVIDAALSVPAWRRGDPWHYKPLIAAALSGELPPAVVNRATKGAFDNDHYTGIRSHLAAVRDLTDGHLAQLGLINPAALRAVIDHAAAGLPAAFGEFEPAIAAEVWLRAITAAPPVPWRIGDHQVAA